MPRDFLSEPLDAQITLVSLITNYECRASSMIVPERAIYLLEHSKRNQSARPERTSRVRFKLRGSRDYSFVDGSEKWVVDGSSLFFVPNFPLEP